MVDVIANGYDINESVISAALRSLADGVDDHSALIKTFKDGEEVEEGDKVIFSLELEFYATRGSDVYDSFSNNLVITDE